jgi:hypothetical protein
MVSVTGLLELQKMVKSSIIRIVCVTQRCDLEVGMWKTVQCDPILWDKPLKPSFLCHESIHSGDAVREKAGQQ